MDSIREQLHCDNAKNILGNTLTTDKAESLALIFKAMSDPTRLKILSTLMLGELCVHDISLLLSMSQPAVSNQLRFLRHHHLVKSRKDGNRVFYRMDDIHVEQLYQIGLLHDKHQH